jgi:hypothetical protein
VVGRQFGSLSSLLGAFPGINDAGQEGHMATTTLERARAYVLLGVRNPDGMADDIIGASLLEKGGADYVIVRADVIEDGGDINLVVPVDAAGEAQLGAALDDLRKIAQPHRLIQMLVLRVRAHYPVQVTRAHSFVTGSERAGFEGEFPEPGRQVPKSPGANPWG